MPTEQERKDLRHALELGDQLQAQWREDAERDPVSIYTLELFNDEDVPIKYEHMLHRKEEGRHSFVLILDKPNEAVLNNVFKAEVRVLARCIGQDIRFDVKQTYSGTEQDVAELIKTGYAAVNVIDQGKPES